MSNDSQNPQDQPTDKSKPSSPPRKDDTEIDLWDLDGDSPLESSPARPEQVDVPSRRDSKSSVTSQAPVEQQTDSPIPIGKSPSDSKPKRAALADEIAKAESVENSDAPIDTSEPSGTDAEVNNEAPTKPEPEPEPEPKPEPKPGNFLASLTKTEKIGIFSLATIFLLIATFSVIYSLNILNIKSMYSDDLELPINGKMTLVSSVETYWREPINEGEDADTVRRGVKLIPAIKMDIESISKQSGALRVLFRNEDSVVVGDNISRSIPQKGTLEITATDGFSDLGMHAAYRTGDSPLWTVEVFEGPSVGAPIEEFVTLFETEISTKLN